MLAVPKSLENMLSPFEPFAYDPVNNAEAMNLIAGRLEQKGRVRRWWAAAKRKLGRIDASDVGIDLGKISDLSNIIGIPLPFGGIIRVKSEDVSARYSDDNERRLARERAKAFADRLRGKGQQYALNVFAGQDGETPPLPYFAGSRSWAEGDLIVVEAALRLDDGGALYLADFPPGLDLPSDRRLPLLFRDGIADGLIERVRQRDGWEPFCQVLAQVDSAGRDDPALQVILVSLRKFVVGAQGLTPERVFAAPSWNDDEEWGALYSGKKGWLAAYLFLDRSSRLILDIGKTAAERLQSAKLSAFKFDENVETLTGYERSFCTNMLGYIAGVQLMVGELRRIGADMEAARLLEALQDRVKALKVNDAELLQEIARSMAPLRLTHDPEPRPPAAAPDQSSDGEGREGAPA